MRTLPQVIAWASAAIGSAPLTAAVPVEVHQRQIAPGVHQFTVAVDGYVEDLNSLAIITDSGVLIFDTTTRPSTARDILARIRKLTDKPIRFVVNSHWHPDHWSGNEVFAAANPGVEIVATEQMRDFMLNMSPLWPRRLPEAEVAQAKAVAESIAKGVGDDGKPLTSEGRKKLETELQMIRDMVAEQVKVRRTYPTLTYDERLLIRLGGREVQLLSVTGDAAGTTVIYLPAERILATGDAVSWPLPYYTPPIREHAASLRRLAALDAAMIVPGHGPLMRDRSYLLLEAELFEEIVRQVEAALRAGAVTLEEVQAKISLTALQKRFEALDPDVAANWKGWTEGLVRNAYVDVRDSKAPPTPLPR